MSVFFSSQLTLPHEVDMSHVLGNPVLCNIRKTNAEISCKLEGAFVVSSLDRIISLVYVSKIIMITYPCNVYPLTPYFYIIKLGFTGINIIFSFCSKTLIVGTI